MQLRKPHFQFWQEKQKWPIAKDHVFLADALHQIGKALYPEEWTGDEPLVDETPKPHEPGSPDPGKVNLRSTPAKPASSDKPDIDLGWLVTATPDEIQQHSAQIKAAFAGYEYDPDALARLSNVQTRITSEALHGRLVFATRPIDGGAVTPLPSIVWQTEMIRPRFYFCQIDPAKPYGLAVKGDGFEYLFVTCESLDRVLAEISGKAVGVTTYKTGLPGRPSSKHLILEEAERRFQKSPEEPLPETLAAFARELHDWLSREHPRAPQPNPRAIENMVRGDWRGHHRTA